MADKLTTVALLGGAGYLAYKLFLQPSATVAQASATPASPSQPASTPSTPPSLPQSGFNSLDQTFTRLQQTLTANKGDSGLQQSQGQFVATPWVFSYYLAQVSGQNLGTSGALTTLFPNGADTQPLTLAQFWSAVSNYLSTKGFTGYAGRGLAGYIISQAARR